MTPRFLVHILRAFRKWLLRLSRRSASSLSIFLVFLCRFTTCRLKPGIRRPTTQPHISRGAIPRPLAMDIVEEGPYTCSSLLPPCEIQEVAREPPSASNFPYETSSRPSRQIVRENTSMSLPDATSLILSMGESPTKYATYTKRVRSRRVTIYNSVGDLHRRPTDPVDVPLDVFNRATPVSDPVISCHNVASPYSHEQLGPEQPGSGQSGPDAILPIGLLVAEEVRRHERYTPRSSLPSEIVVPAMTVKFPMHDAVVPPGWTTLVHPQGSRYFVNVERRTFTQMNICDKAIYSDIRHFMDNLLHSLCNENASSGWTSTLPRIFSQNVMAWKIFHTYVRSSWFLVLVPDFDNSSWFLNSGLAIQAQYWKHCDYFPCLCPITANLVDEVKDMLIYAECDHLTSRHSTAPFDVIETRDYISLIDKIKVHPPEDQSMERCHAAIVIGRIMYAFSRNHFINSHGENCVRLAFEQTVHPYTPSLLIVTIAPFLFLDPMALVRELHTIFVDNTPSSDRWNAFNLNLNGQLQDSTLLATVLLNANVGFLAINSVDVGGRSPIQVASYMSLVSSLGSQLGTVLQTEVFLSGLGDKERRLERLAIIYSLPKTLLMWGMIFFFAAFSLHWWTPGDQTTRAVVGSVITVALAMILYGIVRAKYGGDRWWRMPIVLLARIGLKLPTHLADAGKRIMVFIWMSKARFVQDPPRSETEGVVLAPPSSPACRSQTNAEASILGRGASYPTTPPSFQTRLPSPENHEHHPNSSILSTPSQPTASVDLHLQPHDGIPMLPQSDPHISPGGLPGVGSLQQIREFQIIFRSTAEARYEPDTAPLGVPGFCCTEGMEVMDCTANVVEEPEELEHPQPSSS
ncbi:uncharacterized protein EDB93DRAFT_869500 [Suillus bovinus]|uniref:uncharacterized protein n=1 Tax=Suillus bovinus TaxID=48563 RepID=UPI001B873833|nr:uncharacterized protein EDB93DRAFT_869500 [Suillus bovinus]KAG2156819.1 hypothetical protein EDB93DRAFT_869500 [Suillus bovinus]